MRSLLNRRRQAFGVIALVLISAAVVPLASAMLARSGSRAIAVATRSSTDGLEIYIATRDQHWNWHPLATIQPQGFSDDEWIGNVCATGDGRAVVAVLAPRHYANIPSLRDRGAYAYVIDVSSAKVTPVASGVAIKYHTPGCGPTHFAALTRNGGVDQATTEVLLVDTQRRRVVRRFHEAGQLTSAVPTADGDVYAAADRQLVSVAAGKLHVIKSFASTPYMLRSAKGGIDLLLSGSAPGTARAVFVSTETGHVSAIAAGPLEQLRLFAGSNRNVVVGGRPLSNSQPIVYAAAPKAGETQSASTDGQILVFDPRSTPRRAKASAILASASLPTPRLASARTGETIGRGLPTVAAAPVRAILAAQSGEKLTRSALTNITTPKCAVPRNDVHRQVLQPNSAMIDWAVQQGVRDLLKTSVLTRPSNYLNTGLASYQPSSDFPRHALHGWTSTPIPRSVVEGILAQESAWRQASPHALPGVGGNPYIADYYEAGGTLDQIDYDQADCGYGVSQVTDPMTAASTTYSANGKTKVALDYAENTVAGDQILADEWNELYDAGVTLNGGNPNYLENWYFAVWDYNTGFHANTGSGPWGLGWTNNPQNADYCPCRPHFLRETYADASHPSDWPYQERVIGFMETPLIDYTGNRAYSMPSGSTSSTPLTIPAYSTFCTSANECDPNYQATDPSLSYCTRSDRECWWHSAVTYATCPSQCVTSAFTVSTSATEPANDANYPPDCSAGLGTGTVIVDDQTSNVNVRGCGTTDWSSQGTFSVAYGTDPFGAPLGVIDWHQLGVGFGGHIWFTHSVAAYDDMHVNTATWTPPSTMAAGVYAIRVHVPDNGATTSLAPYQVFRGDGTSEWRTVDQHVNQNRWVSLGNFHLQSGAKVVLSNRLRDNWMHSGAQLPDEQPGQTDIAFDAVAFTPVSPTDADLAARFRPDLRFSSREDWRPLNAETFFTETFSDGQPGTHHQVCPDIDNLQYNNDGCVDITSWRSLQTFDGGWDEQDKTHWPVIVVHGQGDTISNYQSPSFTSACNPSALDIHDCDIGADKTAIYWHRVGPFASSNYVYLDYWYFFRFNKSEGDDHQADWEGATVAFPAGSLDPSTLSFVGLSAHGTLWHYLRDTLQCDGVQSIGSCGTTGHRVIDYVADGSHANYPESCDISGTPFAYGCEQTTADGSTLTPPEKDFNGRYPWGANNDAAALLEFPDTPGWGPGVTDPTWVDWPGMWGYLNGASHVESPATLRGDDRFHRPDQSMTCTVRYSLSSCSSEGPSNDTRSGGSMFSSNEIASDLDCGSWAGEGVAVAVCNPQKLAAALKAGTVGDDGPVRMEGVARGRSFKSANGVAQLGGAPLPASSRINLKGLSAGDQVIVAATDHGHTARGTFTIPTGMDSATVAFSRPGDAGSLALTSASGAPVSGHVRLRPKK